ncbi:MAG: response regulator [Limisphaerales bacterium]
MKKILIIEDDLNVASLIRSRLSGTYEVEIAADGQSGYYSISEWKPNFVILDVTIQQMNPVALVGKIRAQKRFERLTFFLLADALPNDLVDEAMVVGASDAFSKSDPRYVDDLVRALADQSIVSHTRFLGRNVSERVEPKLPLERRKVEPISNIRSLASTRELAPLASLVSEAPESSHDDAEHLRELFAASFSTRVHSARQAFVVYMTAKDQASRASSFEKFYKCIASLRAEAAQCELGGLVRLLDPLERRAKQLRDDVENAATASRQVVANAIDLLAGMTHQVSELPALNRICATALVVDDESVSRKAITLGLEKAQIRVTAVESGDAAIRECEVSRFDLILLDVEMPGMNGFAVCARIRAMPDHRETPILFISALDDLRSRASSKISGGNQFITKPVNFLELNISATALLLKQRLKEIDKAVLSDFRSAPQKAFDGQI